jgi:hypothetical protein
VNLLRSFIMAINGVSAGSYNSPSVQPQAQTQRIPERAKEPERSESEKQAVRNERSEPTLNTSGQTVGTRVNVQA